jgi:hypothetical protein
MQLSADLREFIGLLNSRDVEYVIVGAHSLAYHGKPRYTGDLDILVRPSSANAVKVASVLKDFGFASLVEEADLTKPDQVVQLGRAPHRIDLLTNLSGVGLDEVFETKIATHLDNLPVLVLSKELLIQNKRAVGRPQDLADVAELESEES